MSQDEDGEDQSIENPDDTPEDEIDVVLMDLHKVSQWEQYEKEQEHPIMDHSTLYGTQLEQHAKVIQVLDSSQEHGQSPTKVLAEQYLAGDQYVFNYIRTLAHVCSIAFKGAGQRDHTSQQQFLQLLYQLAQKIRQPGTYPYQPTYRASDALQLLMHLALYMRPRVVHQKQIYLLGTPGAGKSRILHMAKQLLQGKVFTPGEESASKDYVTKSGLIQIPQ